ncbi:PIG-L deacetylase family protein [Streptosporangium sp. NPDC000396]|uniref:PIG-L deacetylase family protein n=1 Tax=Streptosporangium sp. NPDC000396 TaxID=3366185 RepID=UPI0036CB5CC1
MGKILAVSPHLDDAVLSVGGHLFDLAAAGHDVTVLTVFAGHAQPPYTTIARRFHDMWKLPDEPVAHRRTEDINAVATLGGTPRHGDFQDVIYRIDAEGNGVIDDDPTDPSVDDEPKLTEEITRYLDGVVDEMRPELILTCAAIGDHVDHRRTRDAVLATTLGTRTPLRLWEDQPYVTAQGGLPQLEVSSPVSARPVAVSEAGWRAKIKAIGCYASQHGMLAKGGDLYASLEAIAAARARDSGIGTKAELFWEVC